MRHIPGLYIAFGTNGRGMHTGEAINKADIIENCPVILIPEAEKKLIHKSTLHDYYFVWPEGGLAIALGYGSLYNHSLEPNAEVIFDIEDQEIVIQALKKIDAGDEIVIDYTGGVRGHELWF